MNEVLLMLLLVAVVVFAIWCLTCLVNQVKASSMHARRQELAHRLDPVSAAMFRRPDSVPVGPAIHNLSSASNDPEEGRYWVGLTTAANAAGVTEREIMRYILVTSQAESARAAAEGANPDLRASGDPTSLAEQGGVAPEARPGRLRVIGQALLSVLRLIVPHALQDACSMCPWPCLRRRNSREHVQPEPICCPTGSLRERRCCDNRLAGSQPPGQIPPLAWMHPFEGYFGPHQMQLSISSSQRTIVDGLQSAQSPPPAYSSLISSDKPPSYSELFDKKSADEDSYATAATSNHSPGRDSTLMFTNNEDGLNTNTQSSAINVSVAIAESVQQDSASAVPKTSSDRPRSVLTTSRRRSGQCPPEGVPPAKRPKMTPRCERKVRFNFDV